jgi:hypothetical protein
MVGLRANQFERNQILQVYLPIAELSVNLFFLVGIGGAAGFSSRPC